MQERGVRRIDADFQRLQPVADDMALEREGVAVGRDKTVDLRKCRRFAFAQIGPPDAPLLDHGIGARFDSWAQRAILRPGRRHKALACGVEQPAVKGTTKSAIFQTAEGKVGTAMGAMPVDQAVAALLVAKQHQVLAEQFYRFDRARSLQLVDQRRRLPVHPHQLAAGILWTGAGDQVVLFLAHHGEILPSADEFVRLLNLWAILTYDGL